ncbi:hypothetical protein A2V82_16660 [candidate division KSB1 bacterium RBG_16_48_16]|nr:MAG: hypothetical protein A2V82_16660 [candidate division KSB1 bacterium RBG_16_48_16]
MIQYDFFVFLSIILVFQVFIAPASAMDNGIQKDILPAEINAWGMGQQDQVYKGKEIYRYIDGAGEVYLAFDFQDVIVRRYSLAGAPDIIVELFRMSSPENAYGVFRHDCQNETNEVGRGCERRGGLLCFWQGDFFVCIYAEGESEKAHQAITALAHAIEVKIQDSTGKPELLNLLPENGLQENSIRYFYSPAILNYHYFISEANILKLDKNTRCLLANYTIKDHSFLFFLGLYPSTGEAAEAEKSFILEYLGQTDQDSFKLLENDLWTGVRRSGRIVLIIFDAQDLNVAKAFLTSASESIKE